MSVYLVTSLPIPFLSYKVRSCKLSGSSRFNNTSFLTLSEWNLNTCYTMVIRGLLNFHCPACFSGILGVKICATAKFSTKIECLSDDL